MKVLERNELELLEKCVFILNKRCVIISPVYLFLERRFKLEGTGYLPGNLSHQIIALWQKSSRPL